MKLKPLDDLAEGNPREGDLVYVVNSDVNKLNIIVVFDKWINMFPSSFYASRAWLLKPSQLIEEGRVKMPCYSKNPDRKFYTSRNRNEIFEAMKEEGDHHYVSALQETLSSN